MLSKKERDKLKAMGIDPDKFNTDDFECSNKDLNLTSIEDIDSKIDKNIDNFKKLLDNLEATENRKKALWIQIYENALTDRRNAYMVFNDLYNHVADKAAEHAIHGQTISKYLERMSKANEQLIKLADLVEKASEEEFEEELTEDAVYEQMKYTRESSED